MDSNAPRYPLTLGHPPLPPVQTAVGTPGANPQGVQHAQTPHHLAHVVHSHPATTVHHQQHLTHHPIHPQHMSPMSIGVSIPLAHAHHIQPHPSVHPQSHPPPHPASHPGQQPQHFCDQYVSRVHYLETELEKAKREIESLRTKLAEYEKERAKTETPKVQSRYWTPDEHKRFLEALQEFGAKDVRSIANYVGSRNATQVRTHAQKYFLRLARGKSNQSALQAARKRSMSESDLVRVGRGAGTPPGSPAGMRDSLRSGQLPPPQTLSSGDTPMPPVSAASALPHLPQRQSSVSSPTRKRPAQAPPAPSQVASAISIPAMISSPQVPPRHPESPRRLQNREQQLSLQQQNPMPMSTGGKPPPAVRAAKPPQAGPKLADNSGINLLSRVASEREMQSVNSKN